MSRKDLLLLSLIFSIIIFFYLFSRLQTVRGDTVIIQVDGKIFSRFSLSENRTVKVPGPLGISIVEIKNDKVRMFSSPCPDKLCVREGYISKPGQMIVCVPNRVILKIEGRANLDALTY